MLRSIFIRFPHINFIIKIGMVFLILSFAKTERIKYFQPQTIKLEPHSFQKYEVDINDSISESNILFKASSKDGTPIFFYRKIFTPVCFDNKCRPLTINLYWNITGRYLGFELLEGEFLSKTDHDPFTIEEYEKLNQILATESTPLSEINYNQLTIDPNSHGLGDIDGITTATPQNLAPYVIEGAAYTTFKLWHLVHGSTKNQVQNLTIKEISPGLILNILESPMRIDKIWALEHISGHVEFTSALKKVIFELITGDDYLIVELALNAINETELDSFSVQQLLIKALMKGNYNAQIRVIDKIGDCNILYDSVIMELVENLGIFNGQVFKKVLLVLENQRLTTEMHYKIAELLQSENDFISNSVYIFMRNQDINDSKIRSLIEKNKN